jgi:hypothetical protein
MSSSIVSAAAGWIRGHPHLNLGAGAGGGDRLRHARRRVVGVGLLHHENDGPFIRLKAGLQVAAPQGSAQHRRDRLGPDRRAVEPRGAIDLEEEQAHPQASAVRHEVLLGAEVRRLVVIRLDLVRDLTEVDVRYRVVSPLSLAARPARIENHLRPGANGYQTMPVATRPAELR